MCSIYVYFCVPPFVGSTSYFITICIFQVTNFATDFIKYKEGGKRALSGADTSSGNAQQDASRSAASNSNNPSGFVTNNKKKKPTTAGASNK